jgi:hypothetical protein
MRCGFLRTAQADYKVRYARKWSLAIARGRRSIDPNATARVHLYAEPSRAF